jgi:hypothetical protein
MPQTNEIGNDPEMDFHFGVQTEYGPLYYYRHGRAPGQGRAPLTGIDPDFAASNRHGGLIWANRSLEAFTQAFLAWGRKS